MEILLYLCSGIILTEVLSKPTGEEIHIEPCADPLKCLHGVLMHGDDKKGDSHETEDTYVKFKPALETGPKDSSGPKDAEETFHGVLMHGDENQGKKHNEIQMEQPNKEPESFAPKDTNEFMHDIMHGDSEKSHDHSKEKIPIKIESNVQKGPPNAEQMMHDTLMHGGEKVENHHVHSRPEDDVPAEKGPLDQNELMHNLMHGGKHVDHSKEEENKKDSKTGPNSDYLHGILMHGDSEVGQNHDHDHSNNENKPFKFDIEEIKKLGIDPQILKSVFSEDSEDYKVWQKEKSNTGADFDKVSQASVSDSILTDIDRMKKKYLAKNLELEKEIDDYAKSKDSDLNADEVASILDLDSLDHENDDMRHSLELIGSTQAINKIHSSHDEP